MQKCHTKEILHSRHYQNRIGTYALVCLNVSPTQPRRQPQTLRRGFHFAWTFGTSSLTPRRGRNPFPDWEAGCAGPGQVKLLDGYSPDRSRSGASTVPRYSPLLRMMMTRQLRRLVEVGIFLAVFIGEGRRDAICSRFRIRRGAAACTAFHKQPGSRAAACLSIPRTPATRRRSIRSRSFHR